MSAQDIPDSGLPDGGVVGSGGAEQASPENDPNATSCLDAKACDMGFDCVNGRCVPRAVKNVGCSAVPGALVLGALVVALRRRR